MADLRNELLALLDRWKADGNGDMVSATAIRATIEASEPEPPALEALARHYHEWVETYHEWGTCDHRLGRTPECDAFAAEYARLTPTSEKAPEDHR